MTPSKLRALADDTDQRALSLAAAGDVRGAAALSALAEAYRAVAAEQEALKSAYRSAKVESAMTGEHREAISRASGKQSAAVLAAKKAGKARSLRELAQKLGVTHSMLSQVLNGARPMPVELAEKYQRLVGVPWKS